jgi:hypothetical protein
VGGAQPQLVPGGAQAFAGARALAGAGLSGVRAPRSSRPLPRVGMEVAIVHLGMCTPAVVEEVRDGGRTVIAGGETFELSRLTAHFVRAGDPYYGVRLALSPAG